MKIKKKLPIILLFLIMLLIISACHKQEDTIAISKEAGKICGSWAYTHDKETAIAVFREDGTANYENKEYTYTCDSEFIELKDGSGDTKKLRYALTEEGILLYSKNTYTYCGEGEPDGLVGEWSCDAKKWSFAFSEEGTFVEDGFFGGYYTVDDTNSTFQLKYSDQFEDTLCYFQLAGKQLEIEYPWPMVKMDTK